MVIDFENITETKAYKLMSYSIFPRPIAWIFTQDGDIVNAAPFSYFAPISSTPPLLVVSIGKKEDDSPKDTLENILKTKKATICLGEQSFIDKMAKSAAELPKNVSEVELFNIATQKIQDDYPPIATGVKCAYFVDFYSKIEIAGGETTPVVLKIKSAYYQDNIIDDRFNLTLNNVGRGGKYFLYDFQKLGQL